MSITNLDTLCEQANRLADGGDFRSAAETLRAILIDFEEATPINHEILNLRYFYADCLYSLKEFAEAEAYLRRTLELQEREPKNEGTAITRCDIAKNILAQCGERNPDYSIPKCLESIELYDSAQQCATSGEQIDEHLNILIVSGLSDAYFNLGRSREESDDRRAAVGEYKKALEYRRQVLSKKTESEFGETDLFVTKYKVAVNLYHIDQWTNAQALFDELLIYVNAIETNELVDWDTKKCNDMRTTCRWRRGRTLVSSATKFYEAQKDFHRCRVRGFWSLLYRCVFLRKILRDAVRRRRQVHNQGCEDGAMQKQSVQVTSRGRRLSDSTVTAVQTVNHDSKIERTNAINVIVERVWKQKSPVRRKLVSDGFRPLLLLKASTFFEQLDDDETYDANVEDDHGEFFDMQEGTEPDRESEKWMLRFLNTSIVMREWSKDDDVKKIRVAILDTGIDILHPFIQKRWANRGFKDSYHNFVSERFTDSIPQDEDGHGTHCAGLVLRFAPQATLFIGRIANTRKSCKEDKDFGGRVASAITYATDVWKVDIISMSFGVGEENDRITDAVRYAYSKNVAIYAAAAYDGARTAVAYPARLQEVFCIHACDGAGNKATFSPSPETIGNNFSMLGVSVLSTWPDFRKIDGDAETTRSSNLIQPNKMPGTWKYASGTSMATPLAVALAANVLAYTRVNSHRLPSLQKYDTLRRTFLGMGKLSGDFRTVMPWEGLNSQFKDTIKQGPSDVFHDQLKAAMRNIW